MQWKSAVACLLYTATCCAMSSVSVLTVTHTVEYTVTHIVIHTVAYTVYVWMVLEWQGVKNAARALENNTYTVYKHRLTVEKSVRECENV
jgi:hypothetical protein